MSESEVKRYKLDVFDRITLAADGDLVDYNDHQQEHERAERLERALKQIAAYGHGTGICPYGCDTPHIAEQALTQGGEGK